MKKPFYTLCLATALAGAAHAQRTDLTPIAAWDFETKIEQAYNGLTNEQAIARGIIVSSSLQKQLIAKEGEQSGSSLTALTPAVLDLSSLVYPTDMIDVNGNSRQAGAYDRNEIAFNGTDGSTLNSVYNANWGIENQAAGNNASLLLRGEIGTKAITVTASTAGYYNVQFALDAMALSGPFQSTPTVSVMVDGTSYPVESTAMIGTSYSQLVYELPAQADNADSVTLTINLNSSYTATSSGHTGGLRVDNVQLRGYKLVLTEGASESLHANFLFGAQAVGNGFISTGNGVFYASSYPYLWHPQMGYLWVNDTQVQGAGSADTNQGWLYSYASVEGNNLGWTWVDFDTSHFPWIYSSSYNSWIYIFSDSMSFYVNSTGNVVTYTK
ncbi:MAG: hypothetical protein Q7P63_12810 [Verrucomicrobiota bacterium JB022]|nr:hypothetical protein [Verrucomicrobiota bacterium JB022]